MGKFFEKLKKTKYATSKQPNLHFHTITRPLEEPPLNKVICSNSSSMSEYWVAFIDYDELNILDI